MDGEAIITMERRTMASAVKPRDAAEEQGGDKAEGQARGQGIQHL